MHLPFPSDMRCLAKALVFPDTSLTSFRHDKILRVMTLYFLPACLPSGTTPSSTTSKAVLVDLRAQLSGSAGEIR